MVRLAMGFEGCVSLEKTLAFLFLGPVKLVVAWKFSCRQRKLARDPLMLVGAGSYSGARRRKKEDIVEGMALLASLEGMIGRASCRVEGRVEASCTKSNLCRGEYNWLGVEVFVVLSVARWLHK